MLAAETKPVPKPERRSASGQTHGAAWKEISEPLAPFLGEVRAFLEKQVETFEPEVAAGARYALSASGKQLRPVLVALGARAAGGLGPDHVCGAAIVELVHLATLVHDDVIDSAGVRRRQPTVAAQFGNQTAVLLGDCLFAHALTLAAGFPTTDVCRVVANGTKAVCSGEILQTLRKGKLDQSTDDYFRVIQLKTAELFALACELGALLSGAPVATCDALRRFGIAFGTAYQVFDDCLDVFGTEESAGKTLGTDLATGKVTLPILLTHQRATPADRATLESLHHRHASGQNNSFRALLERYDAATLSLGVVESFLTAARESLRPLETSPDTVPLLALTHYLGAQVQRLAEP